MSTATVPSTWIGAWRDADGVAPASLPLWASQRRDEALARFLESGFPTQRHEDWRYTDLKSVARTAWRPAPRPDKEARAKAQRLLAGLPPLDCAKRFVFVNGRLAPWLDDGLLLPEGVQVVSLAALLAQGADALESRLGTLVGGEGHAFAALNTALYTDGAVLHVGKDVDLEKPIHLVFLGIGGDAALATHTRILAVMAPGSRASVAETWAGTTAGRWLSNTACEVWMGENARLESLEIQRLPEEVAHFRTLGVHQERSSSYAATLLALGSRLARNDAHVELAAEDASVRLDGLSVVSGTQHVDHQTTIDHAVPHGTSQQLFKGVLDDSATAAYSGLVSVRPHAQKTDARQANHNLLLSRDARCDSKPQLEIFADDVKCAHGATVGQLDEEAIFYLRSRGLGERQAQRLLLRGFAGEVPARIEDDRLRAHAEVLIERRIPGVA